MFSFIVVVVIIGGSIAVIAVMTVGADNKGATSEGETHATVLVVEPEVTTVEPALEPEVTTVEPALEPEVTTVEPEVTTVAVSAPSPRPNAGIAALLEVTGGAPLARRRFRGLSRLIGAIAGTGFVMALSVAIVAAALMLVLRVLVNA
ncbi:MAG: hypothetical protein HYR89_10075 [Actinobacteria bacterium]|nr:hypothetical protein [Actinomycetota bacterium]MBI3256759.1 hypothetical protein [Actinomycetota bacterium]